MEQPFVTDPTGLLPDIHVGDIWHYRKLDGFDGDLLLDYSYKVVEVSEEEIVIKLSNNNVKNTEIQYFTRDLNSLDISSTRFIPFFPKYDFPLYVGKTWDKEYATKKPNGSSYQGIVRASVAGKEDVTVPAGTFRCFRILYEVDSLASPVNEENSTRTNITVLFAPEIANAAKTETITIKFGRVRSKEVHELTKYAPAHQSVK